MVGYQSLRAISRNMFLVLVCSSFVFASAVSQILDLNEGAPCDALGGESGTCQLLTDCYNPGNFKDEHPPICTFRGKVPVICCPDSTGIKEEDFRFKLGSNKAAVYCKNNTVNCMKHRENVQSDFVMESKTAKSYANNFMAVLGYGNHPNQIWRCSGTLITARFILSAASCTEPKGLGPAIRARIGGLQIFSLGNDKDHVISDRIVYPDFKEGLIYHDIALFQLQTPVAFSMWLSPVCLHNGRLVKGEVTANVWGKAQANSEGPDLLVSKMLIDDNEKCLRMNPASSSFPKGIKEPLMFCATTESYNPDICPIETAGGPLLVRVEGECIATQIGIASYRKESCGNTNFPTIYTRISQYLPWIESIVFHVLNL